MPRRAPIALLLTSTFLAILTTLAVAWGSASFVRLDQTHRGVIAADGDHVQPYLLRLSWPTASRLIWFEKGRVYNHPTTAPDGASSVAVSNWSFATNAKNTPQFTKGPLSLPPDIDLQLKFYPPALWGFAEDTRGWPFPAFSGRVIGTMRPGSRDIYTLEDCIRLPDFLKPRSNPFSTGNESLASIQIIPLKPLWRGLLLNTLFALAAWLIALSLLGMTRRAILARFRKPAGHCPKCNYDLKGELEKGCPECGWNRERQTSNDSM